MNLTKILLLVSAGAIASALSLGAQIKSAAPSPYSELKQTVGVTNFTVKYSRPGVKDRTVYGDLVPYDIVWRTGANATTKIAFDSEIEFGGKTVPAGEYVLFTIPGEDEWTVILYGDTKVPAAALYNQENDVARVTVKPVALDNPVETFTIGFEYLRDESATLYIDWADVRVPVSIEIDTAALTQASIESSMKDMGNWSAGDYANAAGFFAEHGGDLAKATELMGKAVSMNENAFWWQHTYAKMLAEQGKTEAAKAAAGKSLAAAKASSNGDFGYVKQNEDLLASLL